VSEYPILARFDADVFEVNIGNARLFHMEEDLGLQGNQFQLAVSLLFVTYCVSFMQSYFRIPTLIPHSCSKLPQT
jgi:hypothetical protein